MRATFVVAVGAASLAAVGQVPPGYRIVQVTTGPEYDNSVAINNHSRIVFARRMLWADVTTEELFLYDARTRELTQLTNDNVRDTNPDINHAGVIVWERGIGGIGPYGPTLEIMIRQPDGQTTRLTDDGVDDHAPRATQIQL